MPRQSRRCGGKASTQRRFEHGYLSRFLNAADGAREPRCQRERHREPVRHRGHHVPDAVAGGEVSFDMWRLRHDVLNAS
jgi:hypothetical protein